MVWSGNFSTEVITQKDRNYHCDGLRWWLEISSSVVWKTWKMLCINNVWGRQSLVPDFWKVGVSLYYKTCEKVSNGIVEENSIQIPANTMKWVWMGTASLTCPTSFPLHLRLVVQEARNRCGMAVYLGIVIVLDGHEDSAIPNCQSPWERLRVWRSVPEAQGPRWI